MLRSIYGYYTLLILVCFALSITFCGSYSEGPSVKDTLMFTDGMSSFPKIILWAWERPEKLSFIQPDKVGVAFLARTIYLRGDRAVIRPRLQPLIVPDKTRLIAVVRIESDRISPPTLSSSQRVETADAIAELSSIRRIGAIQIDFDVKVSERDFYRGLILDLRRRLPDMLPLSITALASWCIYDNWISDLPVDEAVPMLFRMGVERRQVLSYLSSCNDFRPAICRNSVGISTDEPLPCAPSGRRVYIFHPRPWSAKAASTIISEVQKW